MHYSGPHNVYQVAELLERRYGNFDHHNRKNPLHELLFILCSTKTSESGYRETFRTLRRRFPTNRSLASASIKDIARSIARGGLARKKAAAIQAIVRKTITDFGRPTLSPLRKMSDADCESFLTKLPGVGKKVARCVMMYSLARHVFPVDVHCWRIAYRLGWVRPTRPNGTPSTTDHDRLQNAIPPELRFGLHVNFVSLGRAVCIKAHPRCNVCDLQSMCRKVGVESARRAAKRSAENKEIRACQRT